MSVVPHAFFHYSFGVCFCLFLLFGGLGGGGLEKALPLSYHVKPCFLIFFTLTVFKRDLLFVILGLSCSNFSRWISLLFSFYIVEGRTTVPLLILTCPFYRGLRTHTQA